MLWIILLPLAIRNVLKHNFKSVYFWCSIFYLALSLLAVYDYFVYSEMTGLKLMVREHRILGSGLFATSIGLLLQFIEIVWKSYKKRGDDRRIIPIL